MKAYQSLIVFILAVIISACSSSMSMENEPSAEKLVPVRLARVEKATMSVAIETQGKLSAAEESELSFKVGGIIQSIHVDEGQVVKKGQILASLDLSEINAQYNRAFSAYSKAERDLNRMNNLYQDEVITLESLQNSETSFEMAKSDLEIASFNKKFAIIAAPANGQILGRHADENELVKSGNTVFEFANTHHAWVVKVGLVDREVVKIQNGDSAIIFFDAFPGQSMEAHVSLIPNAPNPINGTYEVELTLEEHESRLKNGFYGKVNIYPSQSKPFQLIPIQALAEGNGRSGYVYSPNGKEVVRHEVHVEDFIGDNLAISTRQQNLEYVITDGVHNLTENSQILIAE